MKSNHNLPKISANLTPSSYIHSDKDDVLFPRGQHPDTRSNRQAMEAIKRKLGLKKVLFNEKWYPKNSTRPYRRNMKPVICNETQKVYASYRDACDDLGVGFPSMSKHLKGYSEQRTVKGLTFRLV
jgi:hypothetical protein